MADTDQEEETETESYRTEDEISQGPLFSDERKPRKAKFKALHSKQSKIIKEETKIRFKKITAILSKNENERSIEEIMILDEAPDIVKELQKRSEKRKIAKQRILETEDDPLVLRNKCKILADALRKAKIVVVYTGAGISTAASIPDYRGPNGVWTLLQNGKSLEVQDLSDAEPTSTHMSLTELYYHGYVNQIVSQNCDGLHLRSGFPRKCLSELHGNMYIELCKSCKPVREYVRLFDVTEKTALHRHKTGRLCHVCHEPLKDTIVHFGEKSAIKSPYRWKEAIKVADTCDVILCLGTSLKVLKRYSNLWCMNKKAEKRPNIYIVNLQWTPKDRFATLKINGKCDVVMKEVMKDIGIPVPVYKREEDPIFSEATSLKDTEFDTMTKKCLIAPQNYKCGFRTRKRVRKTEFHVRMQGRSKSSKLDSNDRPLRKNNQRNCQRRDKEILSKNKSDKSWKEEKFLDVYATPTNYEEKSFVKPECLSPILQKSVYCDNKKLFSSPSQSISHMHPLMKSLLDKQESSDLLKDCMERLLSSSPQSLANGECSSNAPHKVKTDTSETSSTVNNSDLSFSQAMLSNFLQQNEIYYFSILQKLASMSNDYNKETNWSSLLPQIFSKAMLNQAHHGHEQTEVPETEDPCTNKQVLPFDLTNLLTEQLDTSKRPLISNKFEIFQGTCSNLEKNVCDNNINRNTITEHTVKKKKVPTATLR